MDESILENIVLDYLNQMGYSIAFGPEIAPGEPRSERSDYQDVILQGRLKWAIDAINPQIPREAREEAYRKVLRSTAPSLVKINHAMHRMLVEGVDVEYRRKDGSIAGDKVRLIDFEDASNNDFLAVNQYTVVENKHNRRADVVLFINGLPIVVIELKNPADEKTTVWSAFNQLQTYKQQIPSLFHCNEGLIISDGIDARVGTLTADRERFMPWKTIEGEALAPKSMSKLEVLLKGVYDKRRLLDLIRFFTVFEADESGRAVKKTAAYHQFHAVNHAVATTVKASSPDGDRRGGVVWHTQGSGKSLTMAFYAGQLIARPEMQNPTIIVITDRNDLDDQLFTTFSHCHELLRQRPVQAQGRDDLRDKLNISSGGVVFTTIQKFLPEKGTRNDALSERRNIVVIADEAHRSQYDFIDGFARHMHDALPNASFIGFTGTPLELADRDTRAVFGDYISVYDIQRAVEDQATVPIYYESRLAAIQLSSEEKPRLDNEFAEVTEGEEEDSKEKLKSKWAALESVVGSKKRVKLIAQDIVQHYEKREEAITGKAMIVCMSRRICVELYDEITKLRPDWASNDDDEGTLKVVMTGSAADRIEWQEHIRNKAGRERLAKRFKDPSDPLKLVIVRDMWLTGFDVPCLHTMYVDKPMQGHSLMQAIARVNRVYRDKPGGLIVDYLGLADFLRKALASYTQGGGKGDVKIDQSEAIAVMIEKYEVCRGLFHGFDLSEVSDPRAAYDMLPSAQEHILAQEDGKGRFIKAVTELSKAFALSVPAPEALEIRDEVGFFQAVRAALSKGARGDLTPEDMELAIRQVISKAIVADRVIDIFDAAGLKKPDISILSDSFLAEVRGMPQRNLAAEVLQKLLKDEIKTRSKRNVVQSRSFADLLEKTVAKYNSRAADTAVILDELVKLAEEMRESYRRGEELHLNEAELAFYDALETSDSAVKIMGDEVLRTIALELVKTVKDNVRIDWSVKENSRAAMRAAVKRVLRKYNYPPDKREKAADTVIEQAEMLCEGLV